MLPKSNNSNFIIMQINQKNNMQSSNLKIRSSFVYFFACFSPLHDNNNINDTYAARETYVVGDYFL